MIILLSGPSGVGKSTMAAMLRKKLPQLERVITYTSRPAREGEKNGIDYHFVQAQDVKNMYQNGALLECTEVYGHLYGTPLAPLQAATGNDRHVLLTIDIQGVEKIKKLFGKNAYSIWLQPEKPDRLRKRLFQRKTAGGEAEVRERLGHFDQELKKANVCDAQVINLENQKRRTLRTLLTVITERLSMHQHSMYGKDSKTLN